MVVIKMMQDERNLQVYQIRNGVNANCYFLSYKILLFLLYLIQSVMMFVLMAAKMELFE